MYVASLTSSDIEFGKKVAERLHQRGFEVKGVFWLYDDVADDRRLVIATDAVERLGPRRTYVQLGQLISDISGSAFQRMRIEAVARTLPCLKPCVPYSELQKPLKGPDFKIPW